MEGKIMKYYLISFIVFVLIAAVIFIVFYQKNHIEDGPGMENSYTQISIGEAEKMMQRDDGHIIVDVRRQDEYDEGHIPGAVCIPNESIGTDKPALLPDFDQIILVYCRSGRRSKEAAQKLFHIGYNNVFEFGGIIDWTGEIVTKNSTDAKTAAPSAVLVIEAGGKKFYATIEDNSSAKAFADKLSAEALTVSMHDYGGFEKVGELPWELPRNDEQITTEPGDIILYEGNKITVYYGENTWNFTRLAKIGNATKKQLLNAFGHGDVEIKFYLEWSE